MRKCIGIKKKQIKIWCIPKPKYQTEPTTSGSTYSWIGISNVYVFSMHTLERYIDLWWLEYEHMCYTAIWVREYVLYTDFSKCTWEYVLYSGLSTSTCALQWFEYELVLYSDLSTSTVHWFEYEYFTVIWVLYIQHQTCITVFIYTSVCSCHYKIFSRATLLWFAT